MGAGNIAREVGMIESVKPGLKGCCRWLALLLFLALSACATAPRPLEGIVPGRSLETLSSAVSLAVQAGGKSSGGRGYLVFRQPDRFHLVMLSPFGLTVLEVFTDGDRLTCIVPSQGVAYSGRIDELPERDGLRSWGLMRWIVEAPPAPGPARFRDHVTRQGLQERIYYDDRGLVIRKETEEGDEVRFSDYRVVNGVAVAESIEIIAAGGEQVRLTFSEPEVNPVVEDSMLVPSLEGLKVLPFSAFKGF